jgi:hypothetical protein
MKFLNSFTGEWVEPAKWQWDLKVGDYYAIYPARITVGKQYVPVPTIYGCIMGNEGLESGYFRVQEYSQLKPEGIAEEFCICDASYLLTEEQFIRAKGAGWPGLPEILQEA